MFDNLDQSKLINIGGAAMWAVWSDSNVAKTTNRHFPQKYI